jgi:hypothetical protein
MKTVICIVACLFSATVFAQTKLISFRSHSGNNPHFRTAVEHNLFDIGKSNFGIIITEKIDTVIMVSNDKIIVLRKKFHGENNIAYKFTRDTLTRANASGIFAANSMERLKTELQLKYLVASIDSVRFIGFNNKYKYDYNKNVPKK